jgi:tRNA G46 methylase TrmB
MARRDGRSSSHQSRRDNKRAQVDNLAALLATLLEHTETHAHVQPVVVDFCGGSGHMALPLAHRFPHCQFIIVDLKVLRLLPCNHHPRSCSLTSAARRQQAWSGHGGGCTAPR